MVKVKVIKRVQEHLVRHKVSIGMEGKVVGKKIGRNGKTYFKVEAENYGPLMVSDKGVEKSVYRWVPFDVGHFLLDELRRIE